MTDAERLAARRLRLELRAVSELAGDLVGRTLLAHGLEPLQWGAEDHERDLEEVGRLT